MPGVGRTDGETVERGWSNINPVATSTKEMGHGHRIDTLDDYFGDWNWKKLVGLGELLSRRLVDAIKQRNIHVADLTGFEDSLPSDQLQKWRAELALWETDPDSNENPFDDKSKDITMGQVKLQLAAEEASESSTSQAPTPEITRSVLISYGIELEEQKRRLRSDRQRLGQHAPVTQMATIQQRTNILHNKIDNWTRAQTLYMPGVAAHQSPLVSGSSTSGLPEDTSLWLPSELPMDTPCDKTLQKHEFRLRVGQAHDSLAAIRRLLQLQAYLYKYKDAYVCGQRQNTKARSTIASAEAKIKAHHLTYSAAYKVVVALAKHVPEVSVPADLKELEKEDIQPMRDRLEAGTEGRRRLAWIWRTIGESAGEEGLVDGIRVEWCKARARALRWTEETELLREEMRRTLVYIAWQSDWWQGLCEGSSEEGSVALEVTRDS
ncbi:hypothetical protein CONPUDRAFT_153858 [Coniophora puteana RWD-64-598 SS2]|uniref:Uncharacterized protein n=1 Tax=Coniophora puteana (strain RWD-64-598) TaxID=741705 RepID=A0A5M3MQ50_CONPW|nr:uncharacterized protein CONPUDRAFT_153858 [Coniophora puteana RWD-64-598 SS2]EIW81308.1 hypothetical protein CONPUDRAFT_153858 [Coniophora puteana RWD-64-598 SS2]